MITIKEIAEIAGVSEGTVDRVIHDRPGVSKKTKTRISEILKINNFQINPVGRALAIGEIKIAILIPNPQSVSGFWSLPYSGIVKHINNLSNKNIKTKFYLYDLDDEEDFIRLSNELLSYKPKGVILAPIFKRSSKIFCKKLDELKVHYFFINNHINNCNQTSSISQNSFVAGITCAKLASIYLKGKASSILIASYKSNEMKIDTIKNRIEGFCHYFKNQSSNKIENKLIDQSTIDSLSKKDLTKYKIIFVPSSRVGYYKKFKTKNNYIIGFDLTDTNKKLLEEGIIEAIISQEPVFQGDEIMRLAIDFILFAKVPQKKIESNINIFFKENLLF